MGHRKEREREREEETARDYRDWRPKRHGTLGKTGREKRRHWRGRDCQ
jgi:hypothetical protein